MGVNQEKQTVLLPEGRDFNETSETEFVIKNTHVVIDSLVSFQVIFLLSYLAFLYSFPSAVQ